MSYALSFSPEFFDDGTEGNETPTTVAQAIALLTETNRKQLADVFGLLSDSDIMDKIIETNTCSNLDVPVEVWIDEDGDFRLSVSE